MFNNITTQALELALFALPGTMVTGQIGNGPVQQITLGDTPTVDVFFVDTISFCGTDGDNIVGCADAIPGKSFAVNSVSAAAANFINLEPIIFAAPEPGTVVLFGIGILGLCLRRRSAGNRRLN